MTPEHDDYLCTTYPLLFKDRHGSPSKTLMCWGFACGDGWYSILDVLCRHLMEPYDRLQADITVAREMIEKHQTSDHEHPVWSAKYLHELTEEFDALRLPVMVQVKEKFGRLRVYVDHEDAMARALIGFAESMSAVTCENCGAPGQTRRGPWIKTKCDACADSDAYGHGV